jgi:hypothetical protein
MALLAMQPAEKGAHREFGIEAIGLGTRCSRVHNNTAFCQFRSRPHDAIGNAIYNATGVRQHPVTAEVP